LKRFGLGHHHPLAFSARKGKRRWRPPATADAQAPNRRTGGETDDPKLHTPHEKVVCQEGWTRQGWGVKTGDGYMTSRRTISLACLSSAEWVPCLSCLPHVTTVHMSNNIFFPFISADRLQERQYVLRSLPYTYHTVPPVQLIGADTCDP